MFFQAAFQSDLQLEESTWKNILQLNTQNLLSPLSVVSLSVGYLAATVARTQSCTGMITSAP